MAGLIISILVGLLGIILSICVKKYNKLSRIESVFWKNISKNETKLRVFSRKNKFYKII